MLDLADPATLAALEHLAEVAGQAAGRAQAEALIAHDEAVQQGVPPNPLGACTEEILALLPRWAQEAARTPRAQGSMQAQLLHKVGEWMQLRREEEQEGQPTPGG